MRGFGTVRAIVLLALVALPSVAGAQSKAETLADIKVDLAKVNAEVQGLKSELVKTGASSSQVAAGSTTQERLDAIEAELQALTAQTESLQNRINKVVTDGTNRIGDLQYRVTEATGGDVSKVGTPTPLGTGDVKPSKHAAAAAQLAPPPAASSDATANSGPELAVNEKADFDRAKAALDSGSFPSAADLFATFAETYTGGPLTGEALFYRGEALSKTGDTGNAARAYLESFSSYPKGPRAADALTKLGISLGKLGQTRDACTTLGQVSVRYPGAAAVSDAEQAMASLGCH